MTLHAFIQYLRYHWRAQGRHGTHSPFVYGFVEEVLRKRNGTLESRILRYAGVENFLSEKEIDRATPGDVVAIRNLHQTRATTAHWDFLRSLPEVTLSIDLYHIGLLFFRKDFKAKQHFVLR